jgi:two-component system, sensor histidine kinase and response regulator
VLMAMNMPIMDGGEATRRLRDRGFAGPVIGVSASVAASDRANAMAAGCDDYLAKPIDLGQLISSLDQWLSAKPGAGGGSQAAGPTNKEEVLDGP